MKGGCVPRSERIAARCAAAERAAAAEAAEAATELNPFLDDEAEFRIRARRLFGSEQEDTESDLTKLQSIIYFIKDLSNLKIRRKCII